MDSANITEEVWYFGGILGSGVLVSVFDLTSLKLELFPSLSVETSITAILYQLLKCRFVLF